MQDIERGALDAIDMPGLLAALSDLVAIPSLDGDESAAQEASAALMRRCGLDVDVWELDMPALRRHPACSMEAKRENGLGVVGALGDERGGRSLILNGHTDVVPAGDENLWRYPPWRATVSGGRVFGRGAVDMKGGLCCAIFAAKALRDSGARLRGRLFVESVIGEEDGGVGTLGAILRGYRADGAVILEPTEMAVCPAQAGALNFRVTVPGKAAHGAVREEGVSAIEKFVVVHEALLDLERQRNADVKNPLYQRYRLPYALSIGQVQAGIWASSVPDSLTFQGRFGVALGEDVEAARSVFQQTLEQAAARDPWLSGHPPTVEWWGGQFGPASIPTDHPIVGTVAQAFADVAGTPAQLEGVPYGSDLRLLVNIGGTPTVLFGPGDVRQAHRPDEFVPIADLETVTRSLVLSALRFCGADGMK